MSEYPYKTPLSHLLIHNPKQDVWKTGAEIPQERRQGSVGVIVLKAEAYIVGGIVYEQNSTHVPWTDSYNFKINLWTVLAHAPRPQGHFHIVNIAVKFMLVVEEILLALLSKHFN